MGTKILVAVLFGFAVLSGTASWADERGCAESEAVASAAAKALAECLEVGLGDCESEQDASERARRDADACADGAPAPPLPSATPAATPAAESGSESESESVIGAESSPEPANVPPPSADRVAVVLDGFADAERDAVLLLVRSLVGERNLVDPGEVRAAWVFAGAPALDAAAESRLRLDLRADRLLSLQMKTSGTTRFVSLRATDRDGLTHQRFGEATAATLGETVEKLFREIPPLAPVVAVAPAPTPAPIAVATPGPSPFDEPPPLPPSSEPVTRRPVYVDVNAFGGTKNLATSDWAPLASHGEAGVMTTIGAGEWPVQGAGDFYYSFASGKVSGVNVRTTTSEAAVGLRRIVEISPLVRPHAGAGIAIVTVANTAEAGGFEETVGGSGFGLWLGGGVILRVGNNANLGFQLRYSDARIDVNGRSVSAGGVHAGATLGVGFGSAAR